MALDFEKLSPHLRDILLNLKHMSPMRRFNELSRPRFELQWQTLAFRYGIEKLEAQGWIISDNEILNPASAQKQSSPLINTDDAANGLGCASRDLDGSTPRKTGASLTMTNGGAAESRGAASLRAQSEAAEENPELKQVQEEVSAGLEKMAEAAAMETERLPMPENQNDKDAVRRRDDEIWRRACEYIESTLRPRIEADIRRQVGAPMQWDPPEDRAAYHRRQLAKLTKADAAPRCEHIYTDGTTCGSPRLKGGHWCYAHERMKAVRVTRLRLLPMEDGNSIMLNLMEIQRALVEGEISERTAGLLMYNQQLGLIALKGITFRETDVGAMVTVLPQRTRRTRRRRRIARSAKTAKHSKLKGKSLPLMNADCNKHQTHHGGTETRRKTKTRIHRRGRKGRRGTPGMNRLSLLDSGMAGMKGWGERGRKIAEIARHRPKSPRSENRKHKTRFTAENAEIAEESGDWVIGKATT